MTNNKLYGWTIPRVHSRQRCSFDSTAIRLADDHATEGHPQQNQDPAYKEILIEGRFNSADFVKLGLFKGSAYLRYRRVHEI
jgi:hypothetical protein